jgi:hypothetical protein
MVGLSEVREEDVDPAARVAVDGVEDEHLSAPIHASPPRMLKERRIRSSPSPSLSTTPPIRTGREELLSLDLDLTGPLAASRRRAACSPSARLQLDCAGAFFGIAHCSATVARAKGVHARAPEGAHALRHPSHAQVRAPARLQHHAAVRVQGPYDREGLCAWATRVRDFARLSAPDRW